VNPAGEIEASKFGYETASATLNVVNGGSYTQDFVTPLLPSGSLRAETKRAADQALLPNSPIEILGTPLQGVGGQAGAYVFQPVPTGTYTVKSDRPGYLTGVGWGTVTQGQQTSVSLSLVQAPVYDDAETLGLWTLGAPGDDATTGQWIQAAPIGTSTARVGSGAPRVPFAPGGRGFPQLAGQHLEPAEGTGAPGEVQPQADNTPDPGTICFVTGNGTGGGIGEADVDGGRTTLTSPTWNVSGIADPRLVYWRWYSNNAGSGAGEDPFITLLSNDGGSTWTPIDSLYDSRNFWERVAWRLSDYFPTPANIRVRFVAQDLGTGPIVEAAIDDAMLHSGDQVTWVSETPVSAPAVVLGAPRPSPTRGRVEISLTMPRPGPVFASVHDVTGRLVRTLFVGTLRQGNHQLRWDGATQGGAEAAAGVYVLQLKAAGVAKRAKIVVVR
jgi:hypothetical protein